MFQLLKRFKMKKFLAISICVLSLVMISMNSFSQPITFNHTYGQQQYNYGKKIIQANDQGYYILANENGQVANTNIHIIRTDSLGIILYEKIIGDTSIYSANDFIRTTDKGLLITGITNKHPENGYDVLLVKTDSLANVQWKKTYGGSDWDIGNSVIETPDSAYLISGQTFSYGPGMGNIYIIKTKWNGDTIWTRIFGGDSTDYATSADIRSDSTYLIGATTNSFGHGNYDGYVLDLNQNGDTLWTQTYGEDKEDILYSIKHTADSGFIFVGSTMSYNAIQHEQWLMRFDKYRNLLWKMPEFWDIGPADDVAYNVNVDDSLHFIISGYTTGAGNGGKELSVLIMRDNDNFVCSHTDGSTEDDIGYYSVQVKDGSYMIIGTTTGYANGITNIYVIKMANNCGYSPTTENITGIEQHQNNINDNGFEIYPTISEGTYHIRFAGSNLYETYHIIVSNLLGNEVFSTSVKNPDSGDYILNISGKAAGLYFITVYGGKQFFSRKVIKYSK
jgi:hypothetical protein